MNTLLTVSETFSQFWDSAQIFIQNCWGQITASVSISMVIGFLLRYIWYKIKNNKQITNAITKATGAVETSTDALNKRIDAFEEKTTEMFNKFEETFDKKFEEKFVDLRKKRVRAYHSIMKGTNELQEDVTAVNELAKEIDAEIAKENVAPDINELVDAVKTPEIEAQAEELKEQAQTLVNETKKEIKAKISTNQVLR